MGAYAYYEDAKNVIESNNIVINDNDEMYYIYNAKTGIFQRCSDNELKRIITDFYMQSYTDPEENWTINYTNQVFNSFPAIIKPTKGMGENQDIIVFKNGVLNLQTKLLMPSDKKYKATMGVAFDYKPDESHNTPIFDKYLHDVCVGDIDMQNTLKELIGYILCNHIRAGKLFILHGTGSNGKSVYLNLLRCIVGKKSCTSLNVRDINTRRFSLDSMVHSHINIMNELDNNMSLDMLMDSNMKSVVTGESVRVEPKRKPVYDHTFNTKLIMATNSLPIVTKLPDYSVKRRFMLIPFKATFTKDNVDPFILNKLRSEVVGIIAKSMDAYFKFQDRGYHFTYEDKSNELYDEMISTNFPLVVFVKDKIGMANGSSVSFTKLREVYDTWCIEKNISKSQFNSKMFAEQLRAALRYHNLPSESFKTNGIRKIKNINVI